MPRDLFQDLGLKRTSAGGWRAWPASLAVHALAGIALAVFFVRPIANAFEERSRCDEGGDDHASEGSARGGPGFARTGPGASSGCASGPPCPDTRRLRRHAGSLPDQLR
jgi:hypothetical protein